MLKIFTDYPPILDPYLNNKKIMVYVLPEKEPFMLFLPVTDLFEELKKTRLEVMALLETGFSMSDNGSVTLYYPELWMCVKTQARFRSVLMNSDLKEIRILTNSIMFLEGASRGTIVKITGI